MTYVEKPVLSERQMVALVQKTPKQHIKTRLGRGNRSFSYVTGSYVQNKLNLVFGWCWSFEVKDHGTSPGGTGVWVLGKLLVLDPTTRQVLVTKEQFGSSDIKFTKENKEVDYADDMKSAATDALKKCASLLGIAADIYADPETASAIETQVQAVVQYQVEKKKAEEEKKEKK